MNEIIEQIKLLLAGKYQYANETMINYFQAESYPAICFEPEREKMTSKYLGSIDHDEKIELKLIYIEKAPKDRNIKLFCSHAKEITNELGKLRIIQNDIEIVYKSRNSDNNIEFLAEIYIRGEI
jgi:hypothetical protein